MTLFEKPVCILVGLGFPRKVESVEEAYQLLADWPQFSKNAAHVVALNACAAALRGEIEAETARGAFVAFARRSNILISNADEPIMAAAANRRRQPDPARGNF
jgi:hypothetical protein